MSEIPALVSGERDKCTVYLSISGDWGNTIATSLSQTLAKNGFKVAKSAAEAAYTARAVIENNAAGDDPISISPSLDLKITSAGGKTVYAAQVKVTQKTVAYTLENAQKKAFPLLAQQADADIGAGLSELLGN